MRDFSQTSEPAGELAIPGAALSFVVQKHAARHLHYDFRLELDGTLKSWAVPKGPSLDPADKRMAVEVEDHPLSYGEFEGVIPPKHYGAGSVIVWDRGVWRPVGDPRTGYRDGKLKFELDGIKLHGLWALVRMKPRDGDRQPAWLLMKEQDAHARSAADFKLVDAEPDSVLSRPSHRAVVAQRTALPDRLAPQLATLVDAPPTTAGWSWEIKFDGYRLLTRANGRNITCFTRNGHDWSSKLAPLVAALRGLKLKASWLDGEIVVADEHGVPDFQALQNAFDAKRTDAIRYHLFDLPFCEGQDLRALPIEARRQRLRDLLQRAPHDLLRFSEAFAQDPASLLESARRAGLEGLIGKRLGSAYSSRRNADWIKLKTRLRQEFVVGGFTEPKGARQGIGSLLLGVHGADGALRYAGNVGSGFDEKTLAALRRRLDRLVSTRTPFADAPARVGARGDAVPRWVKPTLVAEVSFAQWTADRHLRQAVFHGLRSDKPSAAITREPVVSVASAKKRTVAPASRPARRITHADRIIDPQSGVTKGELVAYIANASAWMLPHLRSRPTSLLRAPNGVGHALFFQKHAEATELPGVRLLDPALDPGHAPLLEIPGEAGLLSAAQMNVIEFHTWNAVEQRIDRPNRMIFDLDPGEGVAWPTVREGAQLMGSFLTELGLRSWLKTSGGKGLHLVVPIAPQHDWGTVKAFSQAIVQHMARVIPDRFVAKSGPRNRVGKIFIDYLRNGFGATTVCAWSARARPGLGVSVPIAWEELAELGSAAQWTVRNVAARLAVGNAPWADQAKSRQGLAAAMKKLGRAAGAGTSTQR